jgi:hypothetical protein
MNFLEVHELLRLELIRRIDQGALTGTTLARQTGFRSAHISNFLNRRRSLSLEGLDRVLAAQNLSIDQLLPIELRAAQMLPEATTELPIVSPKAAMTTPIVGPGATIDTVHVEPSRLPDFQSRPSLKFAHWQRFLAIRADAQQAAAMEPLISAGAIVVLDRHYKSLSPHRTRQRTLFAVRYGASLLLRYVEFEESILILRPLVSDFPVQLIAPANRDSPLDFIVGRVCLIVSEL